MISAIGKRVMEKRHLRPPAWRMVVVAAMVTAFGGLLTLFPAGHAAAAGAQPEMMLTAWDGFAAMGGEPHGTATNPAGLAWLENHVLRAQRMSSSSGGTPSGQFFVYMEPDNGLGAGRLAYVNMEYGHHRMRQYMYSGAWRGGGAAVGFNLRHVTLENVNHSDATVTTWATDVGYRGQWTEWLAAGIVAQNVLLFSGNVERDSMPIEIAAGLALNVGGSVVAFFDNYSQGGYKHGLEGRFGRVLARVGQRRSANGHVFSYTGLGYRLESFRLDATVGEDDHGRVLSLGLSMYF